MAETSIGCQLLVDIMTAEDGVQEIDQVVVNGSIFKFIKGVNEVTIQICMSSENVSNRTAKTWMKQLGIDSLISGLFPPDNDLSPMFEE